MIRFEYRFLPSPELLVKDGAVIPDWPEKMLQEGKIEKVPFILGGVERDGLVASASKNPELTSTSIPKHITTFALTRPSME